ncbi:response regulator [Baia soyae]|uniref:LuxR family two component transcriptional regulator n=1 Tax=Baia soyae TaxID=1544746 RepID=A0A4R2S3P8_9BACL|nr:response regulator transcription factor [Baia soyae]TCP70224.1 LuxR family two component transcriptional regulator [Baia soyae]
MEKIRIVIVEDDQEWLDGLTTYLEAFDEFEIVGQALSSDEAIKIVCHTCPDIVLMDIILENSPLNGIQITSKLIEENEIKVIMLTSLEESECIYHSYGFGAVDYLIKSNFEEIPHAIRSAINDQSSIRPKIAEKIRKELKRLLTFEKKTEIEKIQSLLTPQEQNIIKLIDQGLTQSKIARKLFISERTVKNHVGHILRKLDVKSSREAIRKLKGSGVI